MTNAMAAKMAPIRVKSFNVEGRGRGRAVWPRMAAERRTVQIAAAAVFIVKTSYVDCGKGRGERRGECEAEEKEKEEVEE